MVKTFENWFCTVIPLLASILMSNNWSHVTWFAHNLTFAPLYIFSLDKCPALHISSFFLHCTNFVSFCCAEWREVWYFLGPDTGKYDNAEPESTHYNPANFLSLILFKFFTHVLLRNLRGLSSSEFSENNFFSLLVIKSKNIKLFVLSAVCLVFVLSSWFARHFKAAFLTNSNLKFFEKSWVVPEKSEK